MKDRRSQDIDLRQESGLKFHRGSALSIFSSDRREDLIALCCALAIALAVYVGIV